MNRKGKTLTLTEFIENAVEIYGHPKISYQEAKASKLMFYWSGTECKNGHLTYSYTSNCACRTCQQNHNALSNGWSLPVKDNVQSRIEARKDKMELEKDLRDYDYDIN